MGRYEHAVQDTKNMLHYLLEWRISHVHRQSNSVAHSLTKLALSIRQESLWVETPPLCIHELVLVEQCSI